MIRATRARTRFVAALAAVGIVASACSGATTSHEPVASPGSGGSGRLALGRPLYNTGPFTVDLTEGHAIGTTLETIPVTRGTALTADAIKAITDRLSPWNGKADSVPFKRPPASLPRPRAGTTINRPFGGAPRPAPRPTPRGPLEVLRYQPVGDVQIAPDLSITFNEPMVPLGTLAQLDRAEVPVKVSPSLPGKWHWVGTRTLRFEYSGAVDRLPMATTYTAEVPAGTKSQLGHRLLRAVRWTFRTPPPTVLQFAPENTVVDTAQVFIATFDQRVDPAAVLRHITLMAGIHHAPIRLATASELAADVTVRRIAAATPKGRWLAFRPVDRLANGADLLISIGRGTPSAEGPRATDTDSTHTDTTYSALAVTDTACGYGQGCRPGSSFTVTFNNELDASKFDSNSIKIAPRVDATIGVEGNVLTINAATRRNTTYVVGVPTTMRDVFGQHLGAAQLERFSVGDNTPALIGFPQRLTTVDPYAAHPSVSVSSVGHKTLAVDVYRVDPSGWLQFQNIADRFGSERPLPIPWPRQSHTVFDVSGNGADLAESAIDLSADLGGATGDLVVVVSPTRHFALRDPLYWQNRPTITWVQVTSIGVDALAGEHDIVAWATNLRDGTPLPGVSVQLDGAPTVGTTDADGVAKVPIVGARFLTARRGTDVALLPADAEYKWSATSPSSTVDGFAFSERGVYRPGERVHVKGWFRRLEPNAIDITPLHTTRSATWTAADAFGHSLGHGTLTLSATSAFDLAVNVPQGVALGEAHVDVQIDDDGLSGGTSARFQIQEFRRPEFEVVTRAESAGPYLLTHPLTVAATGQYYAGGALPNAPVVWQVTTSNTTYAPPNWDQFTFGESQPYWMTEGFGGRFADGGVSISHGLVREGPNVPCCPRQQPEKAVTYNGHTDGNGTHYLQLNFDGQKPDLPVTVSANAAVTDVNQQSFASNLELLVHPSTLYVGVRTDRDFVREGEPLGVEAIVTDIDGHAVAGRRFTITASRVVSRFVNGSFVESDVDPHHCTVTSASKPVTCPLRAGIGGQYKISAVVVDDAGGHNRSQLTRWVSGGDVVPSRTVTQDTATVVPDREHYRVGDTATLLVLAPLSKAAGLLVVSANHGATTRRFSLTNGGATVTVPITRSDLRGATVQVDLAGVAPRLRDDGTRDPKLPPRPAFASGTLPLQIDPVTETLEVSAVARDRATKPGSDETVDVAVTDHNGTPVANADVAVSVVDEAVLALTSYKIPDPTSAFYDSQQSQRSADYLRSTLLLANPAVFGGTGSGGATPTTTAEQRALHGTRLGLAADASLGRFENAPAYAAGTPKAALRTTPLGVTVRTNFSAVALFSPSVHTDGDGHAHVHFHLPDNLTRYRVTAVAADGGHRFGAGQSTLTARLPLQIRPSTPRFANFGDRFEFPVVVQNQTDKPIEADVVAQTANLPITGAHGVRVTVPANNRVEVQFAARADSAGTARYRFTAVAGSDGDSAAGDFPVYTPATTEAFATYGVVDNGVIAQPLQTPTRVYSQFGGLDVDTSSTALQALTDAVVYLDDYPYESADAYASRIIALTSLRDVFAAFGGTGVPTPTQLDHRVRADIAALVGMQRSDGSFGMWNDGDPDPYMTVQATEALVVAGLAGYPVPPSARGKALGYIANIEAHFPVYYDTQARHAVSAFAIYVRGRAGTNDAAKAVALYRSDPHLPLDALAWLWPNVHDATISSEIARTITNRAHDTPAAVTFASGYDDGAHLVLASDRRTDGIVLDALITMEPSSDLIPKVVAGLIGNQVHGHWDNIQENGFILVALQRYFATYEAQTPAFVARVWLGNDFAAEHSFQGRSTDYQHTLVPMNALGGNPDIVVQKAGTGRLYYRLGLIYAPTDLVLDARDEGFVVARTYEAVNSPGDVRRDAHGVWHIKPGAMVKVHLVMVADANHTNMALVDAVPAGLEAVNPALATSPRPPSSATGSRTDDGRLPMWYGATWFDHENLRDDRVEAFSSYLNGGTYDYTYFARATTAGQFTAPPARAEEIYAPEVFGRSASDRIDVG